MAEILFMGDFEPAEFRKDRSDKGKKRSMRERVTGTTRLGRAIRAGAAVAGVGAIGVAAKRMGRKSPGAYRMGAQLRRDTGGTKARGPFNAESINTARRLRSKRVGLANKSNNADRARQGLNRLSGSSPTSSSRSSDRGGAIVPAGSRMERSRRRLPGDRSPSASVRRATKATERAASLSPQARRVREARLADEARQREKRNRR